VTAVLFLYGRAVGERLTPTAAASFVLIWAGVAVFVVGAVMRTRRAALQPRQA
jgi:EamA domain-containing membrane protein RarD